MRSLMRITSQKVAKQRMILVEKGKNIQICRLWDRLEQVVNKFIHIIHKNREDFSCFPIERIVTM